MQMIAMNTAKSLMVARTMVGKNVLVLNCFTAYAIENVPMKRNALRKKTSGTLCVMLKTLQPSPTSVQLY